MKNNIYAVLCVLMTMTFMACQDDLESSSVEKGSPAKLTLTIDVPSADERVNSRGIYDYESEIKELALILFQDGQQKEFFDLSNQLTHKAYTSNGQEVSSLTQTGGRKYTLSQDIEGETLSGTYNIYAIANWSSPFCNLTASQLEKMTENELYNKTRSSNNKYVTHLTGDERLPMSWRVLSKSIEPGDNKLTISLRRITSHIIFKFQNGKEGVEFTPTSYKIYNLPKEAYLMCRGTTQEMYNKLSDNEYSDSESMPISGSELEFFMLENVQGKGRAENYTQRDAWDGTDANGKKNFIYTPEGGSPTYVVVSGTYNDATYMGNVSYTIHLGNFSGTDYGNSKSGYNNYTVNRNEKHTYTITINGVNSIIKEVVDELEDQPGAEGTITDKVKGTSFILDAHYETVMLRFPLDDKCLNPNMIVRTPFNSMATYELDEESTAYKNADYQWVHFKAPEKVDEFPSYSSESVVDIVGLARELSTAKTNEYTTAPEGAHYLLNTETDESGKSTTYVYVAAFVDEYFYDNKSWPEFVNQDDRIIILNPDKLMSADQNSILYPDYIFQITQRSIKTTYHENADINAFGIETWNETGKSDFGTPFSEVTPDANEYFKFHGHQNTRTLVGTSWIEMNKVGYLHAPSDNAKDSHVFESAGNYAGYLACLTRNRDENGDGVIDEGELKWYLPALEQYTTIWMGRDRLLEDTRLFNEDDMNNLSNDESSAYYWNKVNLWTSSPGDYRVYWPAEGASYGSNKNIPAGVRCVRSLKSVTGSMDFITDGESRRSENIILVTGASTASMRSTSMTGEYTGGHTERQADNRLYAAFEVAQNVIGNNSSSSAQNVTYYYQVDNIVRGSNWATLKAVNSSNEYTFAVKVESNGSVSFYETDGKVLGNQMSAQTNTTNGTITCSASNNVSVTISTTLSKCSTVNGGFIITLYVVKESGYTYFFQGNQMTETYPEEDQTEGIRRFTIDEIKESNPCATLYSQSEDGSDLGQWRVPNQRELMLMAQYGYLTAGSSNYAYASSTFFTAAEKLSKPYPYTYIGFITLEPGTSQFVIRCVRDASTSSSGQSTVNSLSGNGSYGTGGTLFE